MRHYALRPLFALLIALSLIGCGDESATTTPSSISASDQSPDSPHNSVVIDQVFADKAGWVVVYQDANGGHGRQLGYTSVNAGTSNSVTVPLLRTCIDGETLHALLHIDHGQEGDFEFPGPDEPVLDASSLPVGASFVVSVPDQTLPALIVDNQTLESANEIALTYVQATSAGRVVIKSQSNNAPADIIGSLSIEAGTLGGDDTPAFVTLDRDAENGELLYALLQRRVGAEGEERFEDEFDLRSNGPLMVLFTVSVAITEPLVDAGTSDSVSLDDSENSEDAGPIEDSTPSVTDTTSDEDTAETEDGTSAPIDATSDEDTAETEDTAATEDSTSAPIDTTNDDNDAQIVSDATSEGDASPENADASAPIDQDTASTNDTSSEDATPESSDSDETPDALETDTEE